MKTSRTVHVVVAGVLLLGLSACVGSPVITGHPETAPVAPTSSGSTTPAATPLKPRVVDILPAPLTRATHGMKVRELQARLRAAKAWAYLDTSDSFGDTTETGVRLFQTRRGLPVTGVVDQVTWDVLINETPQPSQAELTNTNPGRAYVINEVPGLVKEAQHRLMQAGYYHGAYDGVIGESTKAAIIAFQKANGLPVTGELDERGWWRLVHGTRNPYISELNIKPAPVMEQRLDPRCRTGARVICISMKEFRATYLTNGTPVTSWEGRFGSPEHPTIPGVYAIHLKNWQTVSTIYGERFPMPYAMFFHEDRAVHFSFDFLREGFNGHSHGCMNMRDYATLKWLYDQVQIGDKVVVYDT